MVFSNYFFKIDYISFSHPFQTQKKLISINFKSTQEEMFDQKFISEIYIGFRETFLISCKKNCRQKIKTTFANLISFWASRRENFETFYSRRNRHTHTHTHQIVDPWHMLWSIWKKAINFMRLGFTCKWHNKPYTSPKLLLSFSPSREPVTYEHLTNKEKFSGALWHKRKL